MQAVVNLVIVGLILFMTYILTSEGLWGSAVMCMNVLFAGIVAFNFYEPLARLLAANAEFISWHADTICMMGIFIVTLFILRLATDSLAPAMIRYPSILHNLGRLFFGFAGATMTIAIILLSFESASVHKKVFTTIDYKSKPPFNMGIDHEWLAFMQWTTGAVFPDFRGRDKEYGGAKIFDPRGEWLLNHQDARPFGTETVLSTDDDSTAPSSTPSPDASAGGGGGGGNKEFSTVGSGATGVVIPGGNN